VHNTIITIQYLVRVYRLLHIQLTTTTIGAIVHLQQQLIRCSAYIGDPAGQLILGTPLLFETQLLLKHQSQTPGLY